MRAQQATHRRMLEGYYRALKKAQRKIHGILADAGISIVNERELKNPLFNVNGRKVRLSDE
ncbi:MAG TPA: hypothetical protein VGR81_08690 [Candidatus Acidoferrales bacterium]|nr:hypothetical protein [Candidatus Acidoferrales bacterium]